MIILPHVPSVGHWSVTYSWKAIPNINQVSFHDPPLDNGMRLPAILSELELLFYLLLRAKWKKREMLPIRLTKIEDKVQYNIKSPHILQHHQCESCRQHNR